MSATTEAEAAPIGPEDHAAREALEPGDPSLARRAGFGPRHRVARRTLFSDVPDKGLFLLFAGAGFVGTFVAKYLGYTGLPSAVAAVGVLAAYAFVCSRLEWFRLHPDRLGDNCYYMGFLFTLASLSAALVTIDTQTGAARDNLLEGLIGSFGVALFSTITGIALRVFFMQIRREVEDVEEVIRNELQDAARHLRDQLGEAVQNLEAFRTRTMQVINEQLVSAAAEFTAASKAHAEQLSGAGAAHAAASDRLAAGAQQAISNFAQTAKEIAAQLEASGTAHQEATAQLAASSKRVVDEIRRLVTRVDKVDIPSDLLTSQVEAARAQMVDFVSSMREAAGRDTERQEAMARTAANLDALLRRMSEMPAFDAIERSVERLEAGSGAAAAALHAASDKIAAHVAAMGTAADQARRDAEAVARARGSLEADLAQSTAALHKLQGSLASVAEGLVKELGG